MISLTLEDIMKRFYVQDLLTALSRISDMLGNVKETDNTRLREEAHSLFTFIEAQCKNTASFHAAAKAHALCLYTHTRPNDFNGSYLQASLVGLRQDIEIELYQHCFVQVIPDLKEYFQAESSFGLNADNAFPSAVSDIRDAGDGLAVGLFNASVFHLMHAVEFGMRALAVDVGLLEVSTGQKTIPLEYAQWNDIINQLPAKINLKVDAMGKGSSSKQKAQECYYSALADLRSFKDAWRNHIMHTRTSYTKEDAAAVFSHVRRFMQSIADYGIKEV